MSTLESELDAARRLEVDELADRIQSIGFECTRCGACCKGDRRPQDGDTTAVTASDDTEIDEHTATVFPAEARALAGATGKEFRDVVRPMPFGLSEGTGETFEWALATDSCGDCAFYDDGDAETVGRCTVYEHRPLICQTYPFSVNLGGTSQPHGEVVDQAGVVQAHECEGLGHDIDRTEAIDLARTLKRRAVRELEEAIAVREAYRPVERGPNDIVVFDSEGPKRPDGSRLESPSEPPNTDGEPDND